MDKRPSLTVCCLTYSIKKHVSFDAYRLHIESLIQSYAKECDLLLFPEYAGLELLCLCDSLDYRELTQFLPDYLDLFASCAKKHHIMVCSGSLPVEEKSKLYNKSYLFFSDGSYVAQYKSLLTPFEKEGNITAGRDIGVITTPFGKVGIAICYMVEFPLIVRRYVTSGADLILCPSYADDMQGYERVKIGARARALENQCYVAVSTLKGDFPWIDESAEGNAGVFSPPDIGFPQNGIVIESEHAAITTLDFNKIDHARQKGSVRTYIDWQLSEG